MRGNRNCKALADELRGVLDFTIYGLENAIGKIVENTSKVIEMHDNRECHYHKGFTTKTVVMPKAGNSIEKVLIVTWNVNIGDQVKVGDIIASAETDKTSVDIESTASGTVLELLCEAGEWVPVLSDIMVVGVPREMPNNAMPSRESGCAKNDGMVVPTAEETESPIEDFHNKQATSFQNTTEKPMAKSTPKQGRSSTLEKIDWTTGADIRPVSQINCPHDSVLKKKVDEAVIDHFKQQISERCSQVKELLDTIEEYSTVSNGLVEMEEDILYFNKINAVMPKKLPNGEQYDVRSDLDNVLSFSNHILFGPSNRYDGVLPTYQEYCAIEEIPGNPTSKKSGFILCTKYPPKSEGGIDGFRVSSAGPYDNPMPALDGKYQSLYSDMLRKNGYSGLSFDKKRKFYCVQGAVLADNANILGDAFYHKYYYDAYQYYIFGNKSKEKKNSTFTKFPIFRFQNEALKAGLTKGYELFSTWSFFDLMPVALYNKKQHIEMSGILNQKIINSWLVKFKKIKQWLLDEPELFDVNSDTFLNPDICLKKIKAGETVLGFNRKMMNQAMLSGADNTCDGVMQDYAIERLLNCDLTRSDIRPAYERPCLTDQARGHWDLWGENATETYEASSVVSCDIMARNPELDIKWDGVIGIDFGTKSTTVVRMVDKDKPVPMPIGNRDFSKLTSGSRDFYENPTIMQFRDIETFMQDYARKAGRPPTVWNDLTVSHESERTLSSCDNGPLYASFLNELKQWAGGKQTHRVKDTQGNAFDLKPFMELTDEDIDPIELYAYEIGLQINNMNNGIFMRYELSYPIKYDADVRERLRLSFERGLKKSLPTSILNDDQLMAKFKVRMKVSEPAAYALCALQELGLVPQGDDEVFYGVFDFGGGTTDFDYGICREGNEDEQDAGYYTVIEHFEPQGDKYLGGENLLQLMAYEVFKENKELLLNGGSSKVDSDGEKKKERSIIPFSKPFEDVNTYFTGSERLVSNSSEARLNMRTVMNALRPLWEESSNPEAAAKIGNTLTVTLFNQEGRPMSNVELTMNPTALKELLKKRIGEGVSQFFIQLKTALRADNVGTVKQIHILLAGNSSKSPLVTTMFNERIDAFKKDFTKRTRLETSYEVILHQPLGFIPSTSSSVVAEQTLQDAKPEEEKNKQAKSTKTAQFDITKPTGKTGVAFGLVYSRDGGNIKVVDKNQNEAGEISFRFFVGKANREQNFDTLLSRSTSVNTWVKIMGVADREIVELKYTEEPAAITGQLPVSRTSTHPVDVAQPSEKNFKLFVRIASANAIDYVLAKDEASIDTANIKSLTLD